MSLGKHGWVILENKEIEERFSLKKNDFMLTGKPNFKVKIANV